MTDHELKKLRRTDLLEMMLKMQTELERKEREVQSLNQQLNDRRITIERAGNLAEAALQLNGVFVAAQAAAADYLSNLEQYSGDQQAEREKIIAQAWAQANALLKETARQCERQKQQTADACRAALDQAQNQREAILHDAQQRCNGVQVTHKKE